MDFSYYLTLPEGKEYLEKRKKKASIQVEVDGKVIETECSIGYKVVYSSGSKIVINHYLSNGKANTLVMAYPNFVIKRWNGTVEQIDSDSLSSFFKSYGSDFINLKTDFIPSMYKSGFYSLVEMLNNKTALKYIMEDKLTYPLYMSFRGSSCKEALENERYVNCLINNSPVLKTNGSKYDENFIELSFTIFNKFGKIACADFLNKYSKSSMTGISGFHRGYWSYRSGGTSEYMSLLSCFDAETIFDFNTYVCYDLFRQGITSIDLSSYKQYIDASNLLDEPLELFPVDQIGELRRLSNLRNNGEPTRELKDWGVYDFKYDSFIIWSPKTKNDVVSKMRELRMGDFSDESKNGKEFVFMKDFIHNTVDHIIEISNGENITNVYGKDGKLSLKDREKMCLLEFSYHYNVSIVDGLF